MLKNNKGVSKLGAITSGIGGLVGGARRGAKNGFDSKDMGELKRGIVQAKADSDEARIKHKATRDSVQINLKDIRKSY